MSSKHFFAAESLESDLVPWAYIAKADSIYIRPSDGVYGINIDSRKDPGLIVEYATREDAEAALYRLQDEYALYKDGPRGGGWVRMMSFFVAALASGLATKALVHYMAVQESRQREFE